MQRLGISVWAVGIALACSLVLASGAGAQLSDHETKLYESAKSANETVTWYSSHYAVETAESLGKGFQQKYPGLTVNAVRTPAQVAFQRLSQDIKANSQVCDVFSSTDLGHFSHLKSNGLLAQFTPEAAAKVHKQFQGLDPDGFFHVTSAGLVLINYNTEKLKGKALPTKWSDLLDPRWNGLVTVGHPGFSGYVGTWVVQMRKQYGWDYFMKLEANKPQIGRSINDTVTMLNSGERSVGAGASATTLASAAKGNPVGVIYPEDGALLMIAPSAVIKSTKNPNAARLMMEFLLSPEASRIQVLDFNESLRPEVPPATGAKPLNEVKTVQPTFAEIEKGIPEIKELWRETFGI